MAWKFKYEKAEQEKIYVQTHQKPVEITVEKKVPYEKCEKCDRTAYQKAKEKCDNRKIQLEKKYKNMTAGYGSILFLLVWYSITTTLFTAVLSPVSNSLISGIVYWLIAGVVIGILFVITGLLIIGIGYQVGKIYRKYCWDIISIMVAITSTAIAICINKQTNVEGQDGIPALCLLIILFLRNRFQNIPKILV